MAGFGAALGLALAGGIADGYAKERQTQADHRRRMAELSYRSRLGQVDRNQSMEQGIQAANGEWIMPGDPRFEPLREAQQYIASSPSVGALRQENAERTATVEQLRAAPDRGTVNRPEATAGPSIPPLGALVYGVDSGVVDPSIAYRFMSELGYPDDTATAQRFQDAINQINEAVKENRTHRQKVLNDPRKNKARAFRVTSIPELMEYLKQEAAADPLSMGGSGDPAGNAAGTQVSLGPNQVVPKEVLDRMTPEQFAALEQQIRAGGLA